MAKKLVGRVACPECGFADAEVGEDKGGNLYRYCPDCNAQYFTRGEAKKTANLRKTMRPLASTAPAPAADPKPAPAPAPAKKGGALDEFFKRKSA